MDWLERQRRLLAYRVQQGKEAVRDVFDANTKADQQRRLAAGQARYYQDQQAQKKAQAQQQQSQNRFRPRAYTPPTQNKAPLARPDVRPSTINSIIANTNQPNFLERNLSQTGLSNIGKETFGNFARFANTGQVVIDTAKKQVAEYPRIVASSVTGNKEATRASQERVKNVARKGLGSTGGIFNVGTVVDEEKSIPENLKRVAASSLGVAGEVAPVGKGIQLSKQGFKVGTKQFLKLTGQGAGAAGAANAGEQYMRTGEIKPSEVALSVATGGLITGGLGVGGELLNKLVTSRSVRKIEKELESAYPGVFGRDLNKVAKEISKTSDEVEINKIIDEYTNTGNAGEVVDGAKRVVKDTGEQTVDISKPTQAPPKTTDAVANGVANDKNPTHIKTVVDALLPNADETTKTALVNKLVKITDPEEVRKTLDEAAVRQAEITKATDNAIPTGQQVDQATQQEQALQEAVPQPVPARMAGESATTQEPTAPTPTAVTDATTATDVPGAVAQQTDKIIGSYTDPKTGQITGFYTEEDLLDKLLELKSIPLAKRSGADANSIQEIETILKNTRNQQTATPVAQVGKTVDEVPVNQADEIPPGNGTVPPTAPETPTITQSVQGQLEAEKKSFLDKIKDFKTRVMQEVYDPLTVTQKADDAYAKTKGYSRKQAELAMADRSITKKIIDMGNSSDVAAETFLKPLSNGESMSNVFNRWIGNDDGRPFMQYLIERFELEILEKQGIWKNANFTPEQVAKRVADFEATYGDQVKTDAQLVKEWADNLVDEGVKRGEITAEAGDYIKNFYQNYVPLERALRDDVVRPRIVGGISATVGKQNIARYLTEAAGDYDNTFDALIKRAGSVIGQTRKNSVAQEFFLRAKDKVDGYRIVIDPEKTVARRQAIEEMTKLGDVIEEAKRGRNKLATKKKISSLELKNAQTEAAEKARQYYIAQAVDEKGVAWANGLSRAELLDMFDVLVTTDEVKAARIINKLSKKGDEYRNATNSLQAARDDIAALSGRKSEKFREAGALYEKAPTGENIVKGYIDGEQFAVIVPDDIAKTLDYMGKLRDDQLSKISGALATPQKIVATGLGAPQFLVKDVARRQSLKLTNTQGLSAFGLRPMTSYWASLGGPQRSAVYANLENAGFIPEKATKVGYTVEKRAKDIASRADTASRIKFLAKSPGRAWDSLNKMAAAFGNADRVQIGYGAYLRAKRLFPDISEQDAWAAGAQAANEALGNFRRTSLTARRLEAFNPYTSATQAGYRSLIRRYRVAPVETTIKTFGILGIIAAAAGLQSEQYADYYEDLINDKRTYDLDNNIVILTPLAHKSKETGNWENVIKIPLPPDLRPLYRAAWRIGYNQQRGIKQDVGMIAKEIGNFLTADQASSIYDTKAGGGIKNVFPQSPVSKTIKILANIDPRTGKQLVEGALANQPKEKQFRDNTSENAKWLSNVLSGMLSPIEIDALADQFGIVGDIIQAKGGVVEAAKAPFKQIFTETKARTPEKIQATAHYKDLEDIGKTFLDDKQLNLWKSMYEKRQDEKSGMLDSATNALILLSNEDVLQAEIEKNRRSAERTGKSNPLYDNTLTQDQRDRVFMYRSMKAPNAAKQNYTKDGESAFVSLGLDEPWYQEFKKKEEQYWDSIPKKEGATDDTVRTFSGKQKPQETPELQAKLDYYYSLPKGTGDRSRFLKANQDVLDFWASQNDFTDAERQALGFKPLTDEQDAGSNYGRFGYGGGGSAKTLAEQMSPDLSTLLAGVQPSKIKSADIIDATPQKTRFKVKLPSSSKGRSYKRIRLQ